MREPGPEMSHLVSVGQRCRENLYSAFSDDRTENSLGAESFGWQGSQRPVAKFVGDGEHVVALQVDALVDERCIVVKV
jgi:hypothetical protein